MRGCGSKFLCHKRRWGYPGVDRVGGKGWGAVVWDLPREFQARWGVTFCVGFRRGFSRASLNPREQTSREAGLVYALEHEWATRWPLLDPVAQKRCHLTSVFLWLGEVHHLGSTFLLTVEKCFIGRGYEDGCGHEGGPCFSIHLIRDYSHLGVSLLDYCRKLLWLLNVNTCLRCSFQV